MASCVRLPLLSGTHPLPTAFMRNQQTTTELPLGRVLSEHRVHAVHKWVGWLLAFGSLTPTVWLVLEQARAFARQLPLDKVGLRVGLAVFGAVVAFWQIRELLHSRGAHVRVCDQGLHLQVRGSSQSFRWTEIRRARVEGASSVRTLTLETAAGEQRLPEGLSDRWELVNAFRRQGLIDEAALPRSWQSHRP